MICSLSWEIVAEFLSFTKIYVLIEGWVYPHPSFSLPHFFSVLWIRIGFSAFLDPAVWIIADPDPAN
jgi:hypothetical protein